jgi:hypothetical protein
MITIIYMTLIYILLGAISYLVAQRINDKELTLFEQQLFIFLGIIFKPVIMAILIIDGYILPTIRQKKAIKYINKQYNRQLKNRDLTDEERQNIIHKRDTMITFLRNVTKSEFDEDEE